MSEEIFVFLGLIFFLSNSSISNSLSSSDIVVLICRIRSSVLRRTSFSLSSFTLHYIRIARFSKIFSPSKKFLGDKIGHPQMIPSECRKAASDVQRPLGRYQTSPPARLWSVFGQKSSTASPITLTGILREGTTSDTLKSYLVNVGRQPLMFRGHQEGLRPPPQPRFGVFGQKSSTQWQVLSL